MKLVLKVKRAGDKDKKKAKKIITVKPKSVKLGLKVKPRKVRVIKKK